MIEYKNMSLASQVYEKLELDILNGTYEAGEVLSEKRLSEELGVSRTPIREALAKLEFENLVKDTGGGCIVKGITTKDVEDAFEVKRRLEILATRWACEHIDEEGLKKLQDIIDSQEFYAQKKDAERVRDFDTAFHEVIYENCGSDTLYSILSPLHHKMMKVRKASLERPNRSIDSIQEHKAIFNAIKAKEVDKIDTIMLIHIEHSYLSIKEETKKWD